MYFNISTAQVFTSTQTPAQFFLSVKYKKCFGTPFFTKHRSTASEELSILFNMIIICYNC